MGFSLRHTALEEMCLVCTSEGNMMLELSLGTVEMCLLAFF